VPDFSAQFLRRSGGLWLLYIFTYLYMYIHRYDHSTKWSCQRRFFKIHLHIWRRLTMQIKLQIITTLVK
jgi:hypothetical protein